jgi:transposase
MRTPTRYPKRSRTEWQQLRQAAVQRFAAGERPLTIAPALGVSYEAVRCWHRLWAAGDASVLAVKPRGQPARLSSEQLEQLRAALLRGPTAHG